MFNIYSDKITSHTYISTYPLSICCSIASFTRNSALLCITFIRSTCFLDIFFLRNHSLIFAKICMMIQLLCFILSSLSIHGSLLVVRRIDSLSFRLLEKNLKFFGSFLRPIIIYILN